MQTRPKPQMEKFKFAYDSLLEEGVWSEPVSEVGFFGRLGTGNSEAFMDDNRSGKGLFRAQNGGVSVFAPLEASLPSGS